MVDLEDTYRKNLWLGFISCDEWSTYYADTLAVPFVGYKTITDTVVH